ncbi:MAG TPA: hypothetical protein VGC69_03635, partial [Bordetella sp.]
SPGKSDVLKRYSLGAVQCHRPECMGMATAAGGDIRARGELERWLATVNNGVGVIQDSFRADDVFN